MVNAGDFEVVFRHLDENGDGKVSPSELSRRLGWIPGELLMKEAELAVESLDSDGDGLLGLEDLVRLMEAAGEEEKLHDLREAFRLYDIDNCGFIRATDLKTMLGRLGESKSIDECEAMINKFDLNGDGVLSFEEFMLIYLALNGGKITNSLKVKSTLLYTLKRHRTFLDISLIVMLHVECIGGTVLASTWFWTAENLEVLVHDDTGGDNRSFA
ncbi:hypothetical protein SADUNF_Sadunf02G0111800 [Salix dunnii]|uniref:EF-hand domain-containing protein n=1 Tax=Salix dunnii TaxID=1413687 RepID=A0A835TGV2_9ROSI|nr:hypothetical protein SADUNF_Sadunf02G0111800 [Salix dunnii]